MNNLITITLLTICQFGPVFDEKTRLVDDHKPKPFEITFTAQAPEDTGKYLVKAYSGVNCKYCKQSYTLVGEGNDKHVIDWTEDPLPEHIRQRLSAGYNYPVFVVEHTDGSMSWPSRWAIYNNDELDQLFNATGKPLVNFRAYSATGIGGTIQGKEYVKMLFDSLESYVGTEFNAKLEWQRTGAQTFPFKAGTDFSYKAFLGRMGHIGLKCETAKYTPLRELELGYRVINEDDLEFTPRIVIRDVGKNLVSGESPKSISPLLVISIIYQIYQIINPKIDLQIPGDLSAELVYKERQLETNFTKMPFVHIVSLFDFNLGVKKTVLNEEKFDMNFTGSNWIKSKTLVIK